MSPARNRPPARRRAVYAGPGFGGWARAHARAFTDAQVRLRTTPLASLATALVFALALLLPLLLALGLGNAWRFVEGLGTAREVSAYLAPSAGARQAHALRDAIAARADVAAIVVRTPEEGAAEFRQSSDLAAALDLLDGNPLPFVLRVTPRDTADVEALLAALEADALIASVQYDAAWRARLDAWLALAGRGVAVLALLLAAGALLVVGNTVRLDLAARRDEIELLQLLGADEADIRRPLLHFGVLLGLLAGGLALLGVLAIGLALRAPLDALVATYAGAFALAGPGLREALATLAAAAAVGWLGARVASGHYLRTSRPADP